MTSRLSPYISFDGDARQALEFYQSVLGGTLNLNTFGESGQEDPAYADKIMHGQLTTDTGFLLMASDTPPGMEYRPGGNITVALTGDDADDLRRYWDGLSKDGTIAVPLEKQFWGDEFGALVDRFGIDWMVNIS